MRGKRGGSEGGVKGGAALRHYGSMGLTGIVGWRADRLQDVLPCGVPCQPPRLQERLVI